MASALVNNVGLAAADGGFLDLPPSAISCGWLSPRISFSRDFSDNDDPELLAAARSPANSAASAAARPSSFLPPAGKAAEEADLGSFPVGDLAVDFEFLRLGDPATMLPADELFSDGKLVPLQVATAHPPPPEVVASSPTAASAVGVLSPEPQELRRVMKVSGSDPYAVFSPRAPRCSSRWRELLGLKKAAQNGGTAAKPSSSSAVAASLRSPYARSLKRFLHRNRRSCAIDSSLRLPLLRESDSEPVAICSRHSLSSSSSGPDHEDLPRLSLDSDKPSHISISLGRNPPRVRLAPKPAPSVDPSPGPFSHHHSTPATPGTAGAGTGGRIGSSPMRRAPEDAAAVPARSASVESPRMNSSGKVVFHGLERSSSSPSTFNGGVRVKHRGMERSYSANVVRVSPVLNVPVCSLRGSSRSGSVFGFGQLFSSPQKRDSATGFSSSGASRNGGVASRSTRTERL